MSYLGDFKSSVGVASAGIYILFNTVKATGGTPYALVSGAARVVKNGLASGLHATGVTLTANAGSITGLNKVVVLISGALYTSGSYDVILSTGSVNGYNVKGYLVGSFGIKSRQAPAASGTWAATTRTLTSGASVWNATLAEVAAVPAATPQASQGIMLMYQALRNKRVTTTGTDTIYTSATAAVAAAPVSYVTGTKTFTKSKYA